MTRPLDVSTGPAPAGLPARSPASDWSDVDLVVTGIGQLATPTGRGARSGPEANSLRVVAGAAVAGAAGRIVHAGPAGHLPRGLLDRPGISVLDAGGGTAVPGFVDPHSHLVFAGGREAEFRRRLAGESYTAIAAAGGGIASTVRATRAAGPEELLALVLARLDRMLLGGTTTTEAKSGYGLNLDAELRLLRCLAEAGRRHPVDVVPTFLGAHAVPPEHAGARERYVDLVVESMLPAVAEARLAEWCDVFCERGVFTVEEARRVLTRARDLGLGLRLHADELAPSGAAELAAELGAASADHLLHASQSGLEAMGAAGVVAVLLPVTALVLREAPAAAERFRAAGCAMAVGTDLNPGTSPVESLPLAFALAVLRNGLSPEEALTAVTLNAAAALGRAGEIGSLEPGKRLDLVVLDAPDFVHLAYRVGTCPIRHVVKGGRVVVRNGSRVTAA